MFIFDFVAETILDQILDWIYGKIIGFLNDFFVMMNNMGVELFELPWVNAVTTFFSYLGWALFGVGLVVGAFECAIGSLYMFSVPRGYIDGFIQWCKQVIGICITAFLQSTILTAGLMVFKDHPLLGFRDWEAYRFIGNRDTYWI